MDGVFAFLRTHLHSAHPASHVKVGAAPGAVLSAKVQTGLRPVQRCKRVCISGLGRRTVAARQGRDYVTPSYPPIPKHTETGRRCTASGPGSRPSGLWHGFSGTGAGAGQNSDPEPVPEPEHLNLAPGGRDPRPEKVLPLTFAPLHRSSAPICTFAQSRLWASGPLVCIPCQPAN
jgi:hypothetical protein